MGVEQKLKPLLVSAETIIELAIIDPSRYGPLIHANIPDYAEILLKIFLEDTGSKLPDSSRPNFKQLIEEVEKNLPEVDIEPFKTIKQYFLAIRDDFRNPLHHKEYVQGFLTTKAIALECLLQFDGLLGLLFPKLPASFQSDLNYFSYVKFIRMIYWEDKGKEDHELYRRAMKALEKIEKGDKYKCPPGYDTGRIFSVRNLFKQDDETFSVVVLGYRNGLPKKIISILSESGSALKTKDILGRLRDYDAFSGIQQKEVEACLQHIQNKKQSDGKMIVIIGGAYSLSQNPAV